MGTVEHLVNAAPYTLHSSYHVRVDLFNGLLADETTPDDCLIADHDDWPSELSQAT
jgi:hypothetical protein